MAACVHVMTLPLERGDLWEQEHKVRQFLGLELLPQLLGRVLEHPYFDVFLELQPNLQKAGRVLTATHYRSDEVANYYHYWEGTEGVASRICSVNFVCECQCA